MYTHLIAHNFEYVIAALCIQSDFTQFNIHTE